MGERNAAPSEDSANPGIQAKGIATGNEKLQDKGQQGEHVTTEREDETFLGGKDKLPPSRAGGSAEEDENKVEGPSNE
jgi:hypothetical protein